MFQTSSKTRAEKFVSTRRTQEDKVSSLNSKLKQEFHMKELAIFENRGKNVAQGKYIKNRISDLRERHMQQIEQKREKMRVLIAQENENYKLEIKNLEETPEQVQERMLKRVQELRETKEVARKIEVNGKLERRFREGADELRKVESDINELKNTHLRNVQMMEKHRLLEQQYEEDMIYAELWKRDAARKGEKDEDEAILRKVKVDERNNILNWQKAYSDKVKDEEKDKAQQEKEMLKGQWKVEELSQKEVERQQMEINKHLNRELFDHNIQQRSLKDALASAEKETDKEMIRQIMQREQMLDQLDKESRERQKQETKEFLLNFKNRSNEYHTQENELERLVQEEDQRQWQKRMDIWKKEEEGKIKLMHQVYDARAKDVYHKKDMKVAETKQKEVEKQVVTKDILDYEEEIRRKKEDESNTNKRHQTDILGQISKKQDSQQRKVQEKMEQERAAKLAELEYMKKIQDEKEKGRKMLDELRKQRPF